MKRSIPLTSLFIFICSLTLQAQQINTPIPTVPFGKNQGYQHGVIADNAYVEGSGIYDGDDAIAQAYTSWYQDYVVNCPDGTKKVHWDNENDVVSEGVAYGMIIAAYMGDKQFLDGLWGFYKKNSNGNGLMNWNLSGCSPQPNGGSATDADVDAAMALVVAAYQWPDATTPYNYTAEANTIITAIKDHLVQEPNLPGPYQLLPGDSWGAAGNTCRNPGYIPMAYIKYWGTFVPAQQDFWQTTVANANYDLLLSNIHPSTGLNSDWCSETGAPGGCGDGGKFGDDACRGPWRNGMDALWHGDSRMVEVCTNIAGYCATNGGPANAPGDVNIDGSGTGNTSIIYRAMFGVGVMGMDPAQPLANNYTAQSLVNAYYANVLAATTTYDKGYYPEIIRMISLMVMSGNFWKPGEEINGPPCTAANLGPDQTICGVPSITLNSNTGSTTNKTYTWYKNGTIIPGATTASYTATEAGTYKVEVDSVGCVKNDEVIISGTLPVPDLGKDTTICSPAMINLDSKVSGNAVSYSWEKDNVLLAEGSGKMLEAVRIPGVYSVTVSASGCVSQSDQVTVSSNNPTPIDGCIPQTGTVTVSIANATGGPYEWYDAVEGGAMVATGTAYTSTISSTTTYFVQDAGSMAATVGLPAADHGLTGVAGRGSSQPEAILTFDALSTFTLDYITIEAYSYNCQSTFDIVVSVFDASDALIGSTTTTVQCQPLDPGKYRVPVAITIPAGAGYTISTIGSNNIGWYASGVTYPLTYPDILKITGPDASLASWAPNSTPGYFDWEVSTGNNCSRLPVVAEIDPTCTVTGAISAGNKTLKVFPNPAGQNEMLRLSGLTENASVKVMDANGRILTTMKASGSETEIPETGNLTPGIYLIEISGNGMIERFKYIRY